jgi:hypothetical protein
MSSKKNILIPYFGWIGHKNIGDEIVFDIFIEMIKETLNICEKNVTIYDYGSRESLFDEFSWDVASGAVLGGGSTIDQYYLRRIEQAVFMQKPVIAWSSGFQVDGELSKSQKDSMSVFRGIKYGSIRGNITNKKLSEFHGHSDLTVSSDVGLLAPLFFNIFSSSVSEDTDFLRFSKKNKKMFSVTPHGIDKASSKKLIEACLKLNNYSCILQPVDPETHKECLEIKSFYQDFDFYVNEKYLDYERVLHLYSLSQFSLNMRLHSNVLSHSVGTPGYSYLGGIKFDDYFGSLGLEEYRRHDFGNIKNELIEDSFEIKVMPTRNKLYKHLKTQVEAFLSHATGLSFPSDFNAGLIIDKKTDKAMISIFEI